MPAVPATTVTHTITESCHRGCNGGNGWVPPGFTTSLEGSSTRTKWCGCHSQGYWASDGPYGEHGSHGDGEDNDSDNDDDEDDDRGGRGQDGGEGGDNGYDNDNDDRPGRHGGEGDDENGPDDNLDGENNDNDRGGQDGGEDNDNSNWNIPTGQDGNDNDNNGSEGLRVPFKGGDNGNDNIQGGGQNTDEEPECPGGTCTTTSSSGTKTWTRTYAASWTGAAFPMATIAIGALAAAAGALLL